MFSVRKKLKVILIKEFYIEEIVFEVEFYVLGIFRIVFFIEKMIGIRRNKVKFLIDLS